jgi:hypothetical protein
VTTLWAVKKVAIFLETKICVARRDAGSVWLLVATARRAFEKARPGGCSSVPRQLPSRGVGQHHSMVELSKLRCTRTGADEGMDPFAYVWRARRELGLLTEMSRHR